MRVYSLTDLPGSCIAFDRYAGASSEAEIRKLKWNFKKWKIEFAIEIREVFGDAVVASFAFETYLGDGEQRTVTLLGSSTVSGYPTEGHKVCPRNTILDYSSSGGYFYLGFGRGVKSDPDHPDNPEIVLMELYSYFSLAGAHADNNPATGAGELSLNVGYKPSDGSFLAQSIYYINRGPYDPDHYYFTGALPGPKSDCLRVSVSESGTYWPYTRLDGSIPLFHTDTGAQLVPSNDPEFLYVG